jgi:hypothetical protein
LICWRQLFAIQFRSVMTASGLLIWRISRFEKCVMVLRKMPWLPAVGSSFSPAARRENVAASSRSLAPLPDADAI